MSESEYKDLVLADYDEKLTEQQLPAELLLPTPGNIKAEIVKICEHGLEADDQKILRSFVGEKPDAAAYRKAFLNGKADPFRPLVGLLAKRSVRTHIKNIDLLALLIDFRPRPYHPNLRISQGEPTVKSPVTIPEATLQPDVLALTTSPEGPILAENGMMTSNATENGTELLTESQSGIEVPTGLDLKEEGVYMRKRLLVFTLIVLLGVSAGIYGYWRKQIKPYTGREKCMIWNDDHFEPVECNTTAASKSYPINWHWVEHFKKINKPDTLTFYSVGKVWYSNYKGITEFFTDSAPYPLDTTRRLLPMTDHVLKKYVYHVTN